MQTTWTTATMKNHRFMHRGPSATRGENVAGRSSARSLILLHLFDNIKINETVIKIIGGRRIPVRDGYDGFVHLCENGALVY